MPKYVVKKNGVVYEGGTLQTTNNFVSVTADGVKTYSQLMDELYALIDFSLLTRDATLIRIDEYNRTKILRLEDIDAQNITKNLNFTSAYARKEHDRMLITYRIQSSGSVFAKHDLDSGTFTDISSLVPTSGTIFILYYSSAVALDNAQGSGGHTIWNAIKTALTQREKLWFADAKVTDDSTEQATKVEVVQLIDDESELTNAPDGVYQGDYEDAPEDVLDASMVAYGEGSVEDALDGLNADLSDFISKSTYRADVLGWGTSKTFTLETNGVYILFVATTATGCVYFVKSPSSTLNAIVVPLATAISGVTVTSSANSISLSSTTNISAQLYKFN